MTGLVQESGRSPKISVIMATWGRGRHILPSIRSALGQGYRDFELIVVGDACTDETEAVVTGLPDSRIRWINLTTRCGSQSAPNNAGIAAARGDIIAYLGHDDIWEPDHLQQLARCLEVADRPDFAVSGLINHLPGGIPGSAVMGIFPDDSAKHRYFFPPSSFAHGKAVSDLLGPWRMPMDLQAPVDEDFLLRAAAADMRFVSTGVVTVHKFASADRYLSYVQQASEEQAEMLAAMAVPGHAERVAAIVEDAKRLGTFMPLYRRRYDHRAKGELARINAKRRGLLRPKVLPLGQGATLRQQRQDCALDWHDRPLFGIRFHARNPKPRLLLPYTLAGNACLRFRAIHPDRLALLALDLRCNDQDLTVAPTKLRRSLWGWLAVFEAVIPLRPDKATVLEFRLSPAQQAKIGFGRTQIGFGIGTLRLSPVA